MESSAIHYEDAPLFRAGRLHSIIYWLGNIYVTTSIRSCPFFQGAIYKPQGMWSNMWGLDEPDRHSWGFRGVNPTYLATARPSGIFFEISPARLA